MQKTLAPMSRGEELAQSASSVSWAALHADGFAGLCVRAGSRTTLGHLEVASWWGNNGGEGVGA